MRLALPDLISNSYFPSISAVELGDFADQGLEMTHELIFPVDKCYQALRDGEVDFIGGSAHATLSAFPNWQGAKLLCALSQGMYWFLVMRADLGVARGDLAAGDESDRLCGRCSRIGTGGCHRGVVRGSGR